MSPKLFRTTLFVTILCLVSTACGGGSYGTGTRPVQLAEGSGLPKSQLSSVLGTATQCAFGSGPFGPEYVLSVADKRGPISVTLLDSEKNSAAAHHRCLVHVSGQQENLRLRIAPVHKLDRRLKFSVGAESCTGSSVPLPWRSTEDRVIFQSGFITLPSLHGTSVQRLRIDLWFDRDTTVELILVNNDLDCLSR